MGSIRFIGSCLMTVLMTLTMPLGATDSAQRVTVPLPSARPAKPAKPWAALEARKAIIGKIEVEIGDVFDLAKPDENIWIGRLANNLHASTKEAVIRRILLFAEGDPVRARRIYETERLLRALPFVKTARIDPVLQSDGSTVALVQVRDAWTTQINAGYQQVGGQRTMFFEVNEKNFLGFGKSVGFDYSKDHERSTWGLSYEDPQLLGSRWTLGAHSQYNSDGVVRSFHLERPFFALDTPWSAGVALAQSRSSLSLYDRGVQVFKAPYVQDEVRFAGAMALHETGNRIWRGGLLLQRQDTHYGLITETGPPDSLPPPMLSNRRLRGPAITLSTQKDAFESFEDLQGMDASEDYNLAWTGDMELGTYIRSWGSSMAAPFFLIQAGRGWSASSEDLTLLTLAWDGRKPATGLEDSQAALSLVHYRKVTSHQVLAALVAVDMARRPDPEHWYYLGGDQGMRGYPNQVHPGDARWIVSCDYRLLTEQRWWGLLRLGFSAFVDLGSIRQMDGRGWSRTYSDIGVGLRLGNLKSAMGRVILVSVAKPLTREPYQSAYQVTVGNAMRF